MSSKYLLDTNTISEAIRPRPNVDVVSQLTEYQFEVATVSVVMYELVAGALRLPESKKQKFLLEYINSIPSKMPILSYDLQGAQWHARERARLTKLGKTPAFADGQIASIAYCNNLVLVTNNIANFQFFESLIIEKWSIV